MNARGDWAALALLTLRDPAEAARQILGWQFPREALWMALALVAAINSALFSISNLILPSSTPVPAIFDKPLVFFVVVAGGLVVSVHAFYWTGRMIGGSGDLADMLALMVWLQALRAVAQVAVLVLVVVSPFLASMLVIVAGMAALWILLNFIAVALQLRSVWHAAAVLLLASVALLLGLSLMFSVIGVTAMGLSG